MVTYLKSGFVMLEDRRPLRKSNVSIDTTAEVPHDAMAEQMEAIMSYLYNISPTIQ